MALQKHSLRNIFPGRRGGIESGLLSGQTYAEKVLSYGPIAYWPLWEAAGPTAECLVNSPAQDGTYTGVTLGQPGIGDGNTCPFFDGTNDYVDIWSAAFAAAFNGSEGTLAYWVKGFNVGVWTDSVIRQTVRILADGNNLIDGGARDPADNNRLVNYFRAGGTWENRSNVGITTVDWFFLTMTWSALADEVIYYWNGAWLETDVGLGAWAGAPAANNTVIGARVIPVGSPWYGYLAHSQVYDYAAPPTVVADLATM